MIIWTFCCTGSSERNQFGEAQSAQKLTDQNFLETEKTTNAFPVSLKDFKDQRITTHTVKILSGFFIIINIVNFILQYAIYSMYQAIIEGFSDIDGVDFAFVETGLNLIFALRNSLDVILMVCMTVVFSIWLYRNNKNARALGATNLTFGPKLTIFSYVIPIVNFWWPFQAMKEIWMAGKALIQSTKPKFYSILSWWWIFRIISFLLDQVSLRLTYRVNDETVLDYLQDLAMLDSFCSLASIFLNIFLILMVNQIYRMLRDGHIIESKSDSVMLSQV